MRLNKYYNSIFFKDKYRNNKVKVNVTFAISDLLLS